MIPMEKACYFNKSVSCPLKCDDWIFPQVPDILHLSDSQEPRGNRQIHCRNWEEQPYNQREWRHHEGAGNDWIQQSAVPT